MSFIIGCLKFVISSLAKFRRDIMSWYSDEPVPPTTPVPSEPQRDFMQEASIMMHEAFTQLSKKLAELKTSYHEPDFTVHVNQSMTSFELRYRQNKFEVWHTMLSAELFQQRMALGYPAIVKLKGVNPLTDELGQVFFGAIIAVIKNPFETYWGPHEGFQVTTHDIPMVHKVVTSDEFFRFTKDMVLVFPCGSGETTIA